jgi:hypothetical protein
MMHRTTSNSAVGYQQLNRWTTSNSTVDWQQLSRELPATQPWSLPATQPWLTAELPLYTVYHYVLNLSVRFKQSVFAVRHSDRRAPSCALRARTGFAVLVSEKDKTPKGSRYED